MQGKDRVKLTDQLKLQVSLRAKPWENPAQLTTVSVRPLWKRFLSACSHGNPFWGPVFGLLWRTQKPVTVSYYDAESLSWYSLDLLKQAWTPASLHNRLITPASSAVITPSSALPANTNSWRASSCKERWRKKNKNQNLASETVLEAAATALRSHVPLCHAVQSSPPNHHLLLHPAVRKVRSVSETTSSSLGGGMHCWRVAAWGTQHFCSTSTTGISTPAQQAAFTSEMLHFSNVAHDAIIRGEVRMPMCYYS